MSLTIVVMSISFILFTASSAIASGYFTGELFESEYGLVILYMTNCLTFTYHSFSFLIFFMLNKILQAEFKTILLEIRFGTQIVPTTAITFSKGRTLQSKAGVKIHKTAAN